WAIGSLARSNRIVGRDPEQVIGENGERDGARRRYLCGSGSAASAGARHDSVVLEIGVVDRTGAERDGADPRDDALSRRREHCRRERISAPRASTEEEIVPSPHEVVLIE